MFFRSMPAMVAHGTHHEDFLLGLLLMPANVPQCWLFGDLLCSLFRFMSFIIYTASVGSMVLISVDRYVAICDPLHYTTRITVNRVKVCVCLLWFAVTKQISVTKTVKKSELKAARTLGVLVVVFLLCFTPSFFAGLSGYKFMNNSTIYFIVYLYYLNSCLNPLIYALFYPWFRKTVKHIVTLQILQPPNDVYPTSHLMSAGIDSRVWISLKENG
ncbi:trace amine-associated receptor 3-like [Centropristis striata]|uniref:trace amine-associated receptor 3-like n=1 Tax=Centropristis striata TaxID=184440 RepID=UPI0027E0E4F8|nr:trace amine-associated receptor 3-like [Centropristis striata]